MATTKGTTSLSLLALALAAAPAISQEAPLAARAIQRLSADRAALGLDARHSFAAQRTHQDQLGQTHTRFQQTFNGVKIWGGEAITHMDREGAFRAHTLAHFTNVNVDTTPTLGAPEALALAHRVLAPKGDYAYAPTAELVIFPIHEEIGTNRPSSIDGDGPSRARNVVRYALAYHVHTQLENGVGETKHTDFMIDAHTGGVLHQWNSLRTTDAIGTANTQYSGVRQIHTNLNGSSYELKDIFRPMNISTYNLNHATSGTGTLYTDADNTWGDGANYVEGSSTTAANGQTAGVDAHYGIEVTYDFYKNVMGRNGIDNANRATYSRVHYSNSYDNAFWDDTCFCMTYGDGSSFTTLTCLDVAGHEMSHGVCAATANLTYSGESGGLNESDSDILGNMVELYSNSGNTLPSSVSNTNGCWLVGEQLASSPLRYMYKPSKDGGSADYWYSGVGNLDVHYSSGPNNHMFFFLSQGATTSGDYSSTYLPSGMTGIGPAKAAQIWYRALSVYLTSSSDYAAARNACISAAKDLYGAGGAEEAAVWNAYHGINVGAAWPGSAGLSAAISSPSSDVTVATGTAVSFTGSASGGTSPYTYSWTFGDGGTASTASASHTFTNSGSSNVTYTVTFTANDSASHTASATRNVTVTPAGGGGTQNEVEPNNTRGTANAVATSGTTVKGYISSSSDTDYFKVTVATGHTLKAVLTPPSTSDFDLYIYNSSGSLVASSILGTGAVDTASVTNSGASATYYVRVRYYAGASTVNPYTLKLTF